MTLIADYFTNYDHAKAHRDRKNKITKKDVYIVVQYGKNFLYFNGLGVYSDKLEIVGNQFEHKKCDCFACVGSSQPIHY